MDAQNVQLTTHSDLTRADLQSSPSQTEPPIKVGVLSQMPPLDTALEFCVEGKTLCIANVSGEICVTDNLCPHVGAPLGKGRIRDGKIVCPRHGWAFDPKTGETPIRPTTRAIIYTVSIEGEDVFVTPGWLSRVPEKSETRGAVTNPNA